MTHFGSVPGYTSLASSLESKDLANLTLHDMPHMR
jgi:hypothetical protein